MFRKKSQVWSVDTMIAFFVFLSAVAFFLIFVGFSGDTKKIETVKAESEEIPEVLSSTSGELPLIKNNKVDIEMLEAISNMSYEDLKNLLGVKSDFCIYFTDKDGNLINITDVVGKDTPDQNKFGIGDGSLNLSGSIMCGG